MSYLELLANLAGAAALAIIFWVLMYAPFLLEG